MVPKLETGVEVACGSRYGQGIYLSPRCVLPLSPSSDFFKWRMVIWQGYRHDKDIGIWPNELNFPKTVDKGTYHHGQNMQQGPSKYAMSKMQKVQKK